MWHVKLKFACFFWLVNVSLFFSKSCYWTNHFRKLCSTKNELSYRADWKQSKVIKKTLRQICKMSRPTMLTFALSALVGIGLFYANNTSANPITPSSSPTMESSGKLIHRFCFNIMVSYGGCALFLRVSTKINPILLNRSIDKHWRFFSFSLWLKTKKLC